MSEHSHLMDENVVPSQINYKYNTKLNGTTESSEFFCLTCNQPRISKVEYSYSQATYVCCFLLCISTIILGFIPFCMKKYQTKTHYCPFCNRIVGETEGQVC